MISSRYCKKCSSLLTTGYTNLFSPASRARFYATLPGKALRDRQITASRIHFIDANGTFAGLQPLSRILASYNSSEHTLVNLTPTHEVPTCRLYTAAQIREMESKAYAKKREKKGTSDPAKVKKECILNWNCTEHDLQHKLESGRAALKKGNKLDIQVGLKMKRGQKGTPDAVKQELLHRIKNLCSPLAKEWKAAEGNIHIGVTLHYIGTPPKLAEKTSTAQAGAEVESAA